MREKRSEKSRIATIARILFPLFVIASFQVPLLPAAQAAEQTLLFDGNEAILSSRFSQAPNAPVTFVDPQADSFAVFSSETEMDVPRLLGRVYREEGRLNLEPELVIDSYQSLYILRNPSEPASLKVVERLPEGGFGRILRYRGRLGAGALTDIEFIYDDEGNRLTILNRLNGRFVRVTATEPEPAPVSVLPVEKETQASHFKAILASGGKKVHLWPQAIVSNPLHKVRPLISRFESLRQEDFWIHRLVRGPPGEGLHP